jgi:hypothetical protein
MENEEKKVEETQIVDDGQPTTLEAKIDSLEEAVVLMTKTLNELIKTFEAYKLQLRAGKFK